ncbi:hypothetical protein [Spirosoma aerolatum]|uniref:hypothetical protein n=1 Tax=Spirosoma aerolatum TaxID=1211326 RepID=UPI0009AE6667|nr:hypothetical protein [Spirosoma aerolatum]
MKHNLLTLVVLICSGIAHAQSWQGQIGINLATLPGRSIELTTAWSPDLNRWALVASAGYTYQNHASRIPSGYLCDCGLSAINTSGASAKVGARIDAIRTVKPTTRIGLPIGVLLIGSQYDQNATIRSFPSGQDIFSTQSASGFIMGLGVTAAMNIRFSPRWNMDLGLQKFIGLSKRTDYLLFDKYMTYQPGIGLTNWDTFWPGIQGIATLNYRFHSR